MRGASLVAGCVGLLAVHAPVRADAQDWLAALSPCTAHDAAPELQLVYPQPGLPALVHAGALLIVRVRLPAALTPPPGVQQARALSAFAGALLGDALPLGVPASVRHAHHLPAVNLRPDASSSLVYRVSLAVPAYAAPGTYTLRVDTPFGQRTVEHAVRVLAPGKAPRLSVLPPVLESLGAPAHAPVDAWLGGSPPSIRHGSAQPGQAPQLAFNGLRVALRVDGSRLLIDERCDGAPAAGFAADTSAILRAEQRKGVSPSALVRELRGLGSAPPLQLQATGERLQLYNPAPFARELSVLTPALRPARVSEAAPSYYPAHDLGQTHVLGLIARLRVPAHARMSVTLASPALASAAISLGLQPPAPVTGEPFSVRVHGAPAGSRVAYQLDIGHSAFQQGALRTELWAPGPTALSVLVLTPDGRVRSQRTELWVRPRRPATCAVAAPTPGLAATGMQRLMGLPLLLSGGWLLKRRRRLRFGNKLGPALRLSLASGLYRATVCLVSESPMPVQPARPSSLGLVGLIVLALSALLGCQPTLIPNTRVEDTTENREVVEFVEKYRKAVEERNVPALLAMASKNYFDDMGTPSGDDDIDYDGLKTGLLRLREEVLAARYQISYRSVSYALDQRVLVDVLYTGWFRVTTPDGPQWKRKLEPHRVVLAREDDRYRIVSGM